MIDAHCHLDDAQFADDLDAVIARAVDADVTTIITAGADLATSRAAVALADKYANIYAVVGIHPEHAATFDDDALKAIRDLAAHRKVIGIGEIGLDFYWAQNPPRDVQKRTLIAQLDLAAELNLPVVIHDRDAHAALMQILSRRNAPCGILHCFSGDLAMARQAIDLGYLISFAGNVTFKNATRLQEIAHALPLDKIVIETDAPYLSPLRGKRNEPANVTRVADKLAEIKNVEQRVVADAVTQNSKMLFQLHLGHGDEATR
ncbi:D-aminoacyl-tRNA deacylase [Anaerolineae bacterium]|nr:D-aminoacyl-tRNA deacylase [Anaerolineae bacterium]